MAIKIPKIAITIIKMLWMQNKVVTQLVWMIYKISNASESFPYCSFHLLFF